MENVLQYLACMGVILIFVFCCMCCNFFLLKCTDHCNWQSELLCRPSRCRLNRNQWMRAWQCTNAMSLESCLDCRLNDRHSNNCTQDNETGRENPYNDIFFIEPNYREAARIRAQLEKDDKDLPSYDEVMHISHLPPAPAVPVAGSFLPTIPSALTMGTSCSSANNTDTTLPVPPFREAAVNVRPLTPPPYTLEPIGASVVLPIATPLHPQQHTQST